MYIKLSFLQKKELYDPFSWLGFNCLKKTTATTRKHFTFNHKSPGVSVFIWSTLEVLEVESALTPAIGFERGILDN